MTGYRNCTCRDCLDISFTAADGGWSLCRECLDAACAPYDDLERSSPYENYDCLRGDAYNA